jgi:cobalt/nickel transport system permease protein
MHLGNGAVTPECVAITLSAASAGLGLCGWSVRRDTTSISKLGLAAGLGAFVFAAQAVNVPILPAASGHFVGGVLLAWVLGPALGALTMALILAVQAILIGDGGTLALGANVLNMALLPAGLVALAQRARWLAQGNAEAASRELLVVSTLSALAVVLAAGLIAAEVAFFRSAGELAGWSAFAQQMLGVHLLLALGEAAATALVAGGVAQLASPGKSPLLRPAVLAAALAILTALAVPFSSKLPDAYEHAAQNNGQGNWLK